MEFWFHRTARLRNNPAGFAFRPPFILKSMPALTLYLDNSVIGGYFDPEFEKATQRLWTLAESGHCRFVASVVTQQEAALAPPDVVRLFARTFPDDSVLLPLTDRVEELAHAYVQAGIVTVKYIDDARHVAIATTHGIGLIVSWNFKHLANYQRESGFNRINIMYGYPSVRIISPPELVYGDEDQNL
jgi:predicted nucleic acid-binding protein